MVPKLTWTFFMTDCFPGCNEQPTGCVVPPLNRNCDFFSTTSETRALETTGAERHEWDTDGGERFATRNGPASKRKSQVVDSTKSPSVEILTTVVNGDKNVT